jgi:transposase-like protein
MRVIGRLEPVSPEFVLAIARQGAAIHELAARFGITEGAARVRLHRATKRLGQLRRTMIERRGRARPGEVERAARAASADVVPRRPAPAPACGS